MTIFRISDLLEDENRSNVGIFISGELSHQQSSQMRNVVEQLEHIFNAVSFISVPLSSLAISRKPLRYVTAVPTFLAISHRKLYKVVDLPDARTYFQVATDAWGGVEPSDYLDANFCTVVKSAADHVLSFAKDFLAQRPLIHLSGGDAEDKFAAKVPSNAVSVKHQDEPELYEAIIRLQREKNPSCATSGFIIDGTLYGAADVTQDQLAQASSKVEHALIQRCKDLINRHNVMVFIKGTKDQPFCKFSKAMVGLLKEAQIDFDYFDIFTDNDVREKLKEVSRWKTYPQLYVKGELMGGIDAVNQMIEEHRGTAKDLKSILGISS